MIIKIKKLHKDAVIPKYAKDGDAGMDLTATSKIYDDKGNVSYGTGLGFEIPKGFVGFLFPRSSNANQDIILTNSVGVIDSGYRGEVSMKFKPALVYVGEDFEEAYNSTEFSDISTPNRVEGYSDYNVGERIGQIIIIPIPEFEFEEVEELSETERGTGGYGSTGL